MLKKTFILGLLPALLVMLSGSLAQATYLYPFHVFTANGDYFDSTELNMYMVVSNGFEQVDFTFYNISSVQSSLVRIYFVDGSLLDIASITNGPGTSFSEVYPGPGNLPSGEMIGFVADGELSIGAVAPPPENGVNPPPPDEWVEINFDLVPGGTLEGVISELNSGVLRVGIHIIDLPDGSSESAIAIPEPATVGILGLGVLTLLRRKR